jgi:hypothetical protein
VKLFECQSCGNLLYFENRTCGNCGRRLGFLPERSKICALEPDGDGWRTRGVDGPPRHFCANADHDACNWLVEDGAIYCRACRHNGIIPDLSDPVALVRWRELEFAKHRLFYSLLKWKLPLLTRAEDAEHGLIFNFLADAPAATQIMTGHDNGAITIALAEADDVERERRRHEMNEPYRTLLGHFRHEVGHYYWDILVRDGDKLDGCRSLFGDDSMDYQAALERYYREGAPADWQQNFVSAYASAHPWEDFAETWAHYVHIVDTLEMATEFGMDVHPRPDRGGELSVHLSFNPYLKTDIQALVAAWLPFVFAMNSVNRAMGHRDLYPFVLSPVVIEKLNFVHELIHGHLDDASSGAMPKQNVLQPAN